jgi:hypothetical protein
MECRRITFRIECYGYWNILKTCGLPSLVNLNSVRCLGRADVGPVILASPTLSGVPTWALG